MPIAKNSSNIYIMKYFKTIVFLILSMFLMQNLFAQNVMTNSNGEAIIVYPDGSWKYFDKNNPKDVELLKKRKYKEVDPTPSSVDPKKKRKTEKKKSKAEKNKREKAKKNKNSSKKSKTSKSKTSKKKKVKPPKKKKSKTAKPAKKATKDKVKKQGFTAEEEAISTREILNLLEELKVTEKKAIREEQDAKEKAFLLERKVKAAFKGDYTSQEEIVRLEDELIKARAVETKAKADRKKAVKDVRFVESLVPMKKAQRDKKLAKHFKTTKETGAGRDAMAESDRKENIETAGAYRTIGGKKFRKYNPEEDVMYFPPLAACGFAFNGFDEFTGKTRVELESKVLFAETSERLRKHFVDRDYLTCRANLTAISGGVRYIDMEFIIASELAQREFGILEKGAMMSIRMIDGTTVKLFNRKTDIGLIDPGSKTTTYRGKFVLSSRDEKDLSKNEIDKIRVVWSTGFEDYEIFEVDFFINQIRCMNNQ